MRLFICALLILLFIGSQQVFATNYYADSERGNDDNTGTSINHPFKSLKKLSELALEPGDNLFLAAGRTFSGSLILENIQGSPENPIEISSYYLGHAERGKRAQIDASSGSHGIYFLNSSHIQVKNLKIRANGKKPTTSKLNMRCGVLVQVTKSGDYTDISLSHLLIEDIFFEEEGFERGAKDVKTANGSQSYGWGIRFINRVENATLRNILVDDCIVKNVAHTGIKFTGRNLNIREVKVYDNEVLETGGPGIQFSGVLGGHIKGNFVNKSGSNDDSRKWGRGSGLWTWGCTDILIEKNHFLNANGPADSAGCHIDFNCKNVVVQYNFSANNAGGFCEILGNNYNCAYRYNISVNDGHRVKGEKGAFQEGKTFWLSGYVGKKKQRHGPYHSYFYNNTIYVSEDIVSKIAVTKTAQGVLVANNIFYLEGETKAVLGDQYNPAKAGGTDIASYIFEHNLFLKANSWPKEVLVQPKDTFVGDPHFYQPGGFALVDYIPMHTTLIKDKGIAIPLLPGDALGLKIGLEVSKDILGNEIIGKPDLGAIEVE